MQKMNIVYKRLDELRPYENNAKTHPESQLANIAHSIENYGWKQPVVIETPTESSSSDTGAYRRHSGQTCCETSLCRAL